MRALPTLLLSLVYGQFAVSSALAADSQPHYVVLVSVDGLAATYLDDPRAPLPNLRKLARQGAHLLGVELPTAEGRVLTEILDER